MLGEPAVLSTFLNISERKKAELELDEVINRYQTLFETANDAIFLIKNDVFLECNQKTLEIFGANRDQILNKTPYIFSPPKQPNGKDSKKEAIKKMKLALSGKPQVFEGGKNGHRRRRSDAGLGISCMEKSTSASLY